MGEKLIRVERFEELRTGMRVVLEPCNWCGRSHCGLLGNFAASVSGENSNGRVYSAPGYLFDACRPRRWIVPASVAKRMIFRFANDLGIEDQLAAEPNPYLSREVIGTNGRDEVVVAAKERTR